MAVDFKELMNRKVDEQKRPPALPAGTYEGIVRGYKPEERTYRQGEDPTPVITFTIQLTAPGDGVDEEDLVDQDGNPLDVSKQRVRWDASFEPARQWILTEFLQSCGIETEGRSFGETLPDTNNAPVLVTINQKEGTGSRSGEVFNNVVRCTGTANAE